MRILHFCMLAPFTEGYSYQDNLLTEYQYKHGHDVRIITTTKTRGENGRYTYTEPQQKTLDNGVEVVRISVKSRIRNAFGFFSGMMYQLIDFQPDLIFIHGLCSFIPNDAIKYKKKYNNSVRIVADNHQDSWTTQTKGFFSSLVFFTFKNKWKKWIKSVDRVYGTTSWRVDFARDFYGIPIERLDVLAMGIDEDGLPENKEETRRTIRSERNISDRSFVFISGGKMDADKHILESILAFSKIDNNDISFLVFGSVSQNIQNDFFKLIKRDKRIKYLEYLDSSQIKKYFLASDFGVFPGRHSVLWEEAIGCGLPCLFHKYGKKDHTNVCENCICIKEYDEESINTVMQAVLNDKELYNKMKGNAEKAAEMFSYHSIAEKSIECCK